MTTVDINGAGGPGNNLSWVGGPVFSYANGPVGRLAASGARPIILTNLDLYVSGRYNAETARFFIAEADGSGYAGSEPFGVAAQYGVTTLRGAYVGKGVANAVGQQFRVGQDWGGGLRVYGRHANGGFNVHRGDGGVQWGGYFLAGRLNYAEVPTAPQAVGIVQLGPNVARISWAAPADDGGTPVTGYVIQLTSALPWGAAYVNPITVGAGARSYDWAGLTPGLWHVRVFALNAVTAGPGGGTASLESATASVQMTSGATGDLDSWERFGVMPAGMVENTPAGIRRMQITNLMSGYGAVSAIVKENYVSSGARTLLAEQHGARRVVTGLTSGRTYRLNAVGAWMGTVGDAGGGGQTPTLYQLGVEGIGWLPAIDFSLATQARDMGTLEFVATSASHTIAYRLAETVTRTGPVEMEAFAIFDVRLVELPTSVSPYALQSIAYEGSLLDHFDMACNSVDGRWWVDRDGVTQFAAQLQDGPLLATFADVKGDGYLEYVDIGMAYDTRAIVNDLSLTNHGAELGEDGWNADDETRNYKNLTSIATWGARGADVDMSLYDQGAYAGSVDARADDLLEDALTLGAEPVWIRWNAQEQPAMASSLEIYGCVDILFRGTNYPCRIINLKHELTPTRWMIRLELIRR